MKRLFAGGVALAVVLGCGGTPIKLQVGDAKLEVNSPDEASGTAPTQRASSPKPAPAKKGRGQIQVVTGRGIAPQVDGRAMEATLEGHFLEVNSGRRELVVYNLLGRRKASKSVNVKAGRRHVYSWDGRSITSSGERAMSKMPAAPDFSGDVVISGLLVADASTRVTVDGKSAVRTSTGAFRRQGVDPGSQHVHIHAGGFDLYDGPVTVGIGGETRCTFVIGNGAWQPDCTHYP